MKTTLTSIILFLLILTSAESEIIRFSEVCADGTPNSTKLVLKDRNYAETLSVKNDVIASDSDIENVSFLKDEQGPVISLTFSKDSATRIDAAIKDLLGHRLAIIIDGKIVSAPVLRTSQLNGRVHITGNFSEEEAKSIAETFNHRKTEQGAAANP